MNSQYAIAVLDDGQMSKAQSLASELDLPLVDLLGSDLRQYSKQLEKHSYLIFYEGNILKLLSTEGQLGSAYYVDFCSKQSKHFKINQGKGKLPISKACGIKQNHRPFIIDGTAGFGQDSFLLASFGSEVNCVERNPIVAKLLENALFRALDCSEAVQSIAQRINLYNDSSESYLLNHQAEVIYLDPMYPVHENQKVAKVKKQMQILRDLGDTESNEKSLFEAGYNAAVQRLVVKRPNWASNLDQRNPSFHIPGKTHRYDVYLR